LSAPAKIHSATDSQVFSDFGFGSSLAGI